MTQQTAIFLETMSISMDFPAADEEVMPGVKWGQIEAFPSPAYWAFQVLARRLMNRSVRYRLGSTLKEEVGACLLGGHGIPATVGLAAFRHLQGKGAFGSCPPDEHELRIWLMEPLNIEGRMVRYRFAAQKAKYLALAMKRLVTEDAPLTSGSALRNWLLSSPGIGFKTASWVARNWLDADDVAILDIHIYRAGLLAGFFEPGRTVERDYLHLEERFIAFSRGIGIQASELDAVMWHEMMVSGKTVHRLLSANSHLFVSEPKKSVLSWRSKKGCANANQLSFRV